MVPPCVPHACPVPYEPCLSVHSCIIPPPPIMMSSIWLPPVTSNAVLFSPHCLSVQNIATNTSNFIILKLLECRYSAWCTHTHTHIHTHTCTYTHPCTQLYTCHLPTCCHMCMLYHNPLPISVCDTLCLFTIQNYSISCMS